MKQKMQRFCRRVIATACAASMVLGGILSDIGTVVTHAAGEHTLWLVGDSTVSSFDDKYFYPRYGYGTQIENYLDDTYTVRNVAASGTSSKSFLKNDNYSTLTSGIKAGDTLIIGFGHNDEKYEAGRYTDPNGDWETEGSFAKSLYDNYIKVAQDVGAEVILCTPIVRRTGGDRLHITTGGTDAAGNSYAGGDYPQAIKDLGAAKNVPVVDLTSLTDALYTDLGEAETLYLHAWTSKKESSVDNTHLNYYGAKRVAWLLANAVSELDDTLAVKEHINLDAGEPSKETDLPKAEYPDYEEPTYSNDLADSKICSDYVIGEGDTAVHFKGTAFGDLGGNPSASNHILGSDADGNMRIAVQNNKGKITPTADGIAMYYYRVPVGSKIRLSAKATVNSLDTTNSQVAFGLMARDDMYIDYYDKAIASDYVAAGVLGGSGCNCFYRRNGKLGGQAALTSEKIAVGSSYDLSIESNTDGYACTFGNEPTQTDGYDFQLTGVDSDYVYIGMFAARNADISYSQIFLEVDGQVVVDNRKTEYAVTVTSAENGTAKANKISAAEGETVKLTATPDEGYLFREWVVISGGVTIENDQFTMPAGAVEVKAVFEKLRTEWDFSKDDTIAGKKEGESYTGNGIVLEGSAGVLAGLQIDATKGKWDSSESLSKTWAQVNKDTVITVPVTGACKVTVYGYSADYTVDGTAATVANGAETFVCEGKKKQVVIIATANTYLRSIKVEELSWLAEGLTEFNKIGGLQQGDVPTIKGITLNNVTWNDAQHGLNAANGSTMTLSLPHKTTITLVTCCYGAGANATVKASSGTVSSVATTEAANGTTGMSFTVTEADAGDLTLTFGGGSVFVHSILVEYIIEIGPRNIDVWDLGGQLETDTNLYTNNITPDAWKDAEVIVNKQITKAVSFGDLTITPAGGDRLYTNVEELKELNYGSFGDAQHKYEDGYTAAGAFYSNGTGGSSRRYLTIANVQAGDKIVAYMGVVQKGDSQFFFEGLGGASGQKDAVDAPNGVFGKYEFIAEKTGTYKLWENNLGKPMWHRVMRVPGVAVSGTINFGEYTGSGHSVKFINQTTKKETQAVLDGGNFTATLAPGYTYTAVFSGATGFGFTTASKTVVTTDAESVTGKENVALVVEPKSTYTYSGKITGFAAGYDVSKLTLTMVPPADSSLDEVKAAVDENLNFTATLEPDVVYTIQIAGVNDYEVKSSTTVEQNSNYQEDIEVGLKPMYEVSGGFIGLDGAEVTKLIFANLDDKYEYEATVSQDGYSVRLRDGAYLAKATVKDYRTQTHVVVAGKAVSRDLMFVSTVAAPSQPLVSDIYVGYSDKQNNYETIGDAVAACAAMKPAKEEDRITVHIAPGTYREQIVLETPYISFVNDTDKEVLITWYYGIGYKYYSADSRGFYNPEMAYDKYDKKIASKWGTAVYVYKTAEGFRADGITFENSFNRYLTDEELEDGVEFTGETIKVERKYGLDVQSKSATERAAAIVVEADKVEFNNCAFYSSQDTVYAANSGAHMYFKNCFIEGQTDYIFGEGSAVFDACELSWKGYSEDSQGGYITAGRPGSGDAGYLFRNCVVSGNDKLTVKTGYFGRPWGEDAKVMFLNTRLQSEDLIHAGGWAPWSGKDTDIPLLKKTNFKEYNTTLLDGTAVDMNNRRVDLMTQEAAEKVEVKDYFGSWTPVFYKEEAAEVAFVTKPFVTDNGDLNTPYPGHKLTVGYSLGDANNANDASLIQWYRVKDGVETLVKSSNAVMDKTYKIAREDVGSYIKVVVTPTTVSGKTGEAAGCTVEAVVGEGYEDPDATGGDAVLGDGVNIFLAGDSTVKDYSAKGINSGGTARNEGAWGEFLQSYFDREKVTIVNYANGGRSARNFINEGSLDEIAKNIGEGDYLFIQFGHNDSSNGAAYLADRYVPLGTPDANGVYPTTPGEKKPTPAELANNKYGATCYTYDCGGTYKWFLKQYIDVAKEKKAIPVLVTPVARMYYNADGTIRPHHDSTDTTTNTQVTSNNAYVTAVKQLAAEEEVLLIDGFELTKSLFEDAWKAAGGKDVYGTQIMHTGDKTHNNKLGGMIEAAAIASAIQNLDINISYAVKAPSQVMGETADKEPKTVFVVNGNSKFTANDINSNYTERAPYWESVGQEMIDAISEKAKELGSSGENPNPPAKKQYTITIDRQDGTKAVEKVIEAGTALTETDLPSTLTREDYIFQGWVDENGEAIKVPYTPTKSMTIKAKWQKQVGENQYAITIDKQDGSEPEEKVIEAGTALTKADLPSNLTREGYTFQGWVDENGEAIKVPYTPTKSMTIKAKWQKNTTETKVGLQVELAKPDEKRVYTGSAIKPAIIVTNNGELLTEGVDYTVKYSNNIKACVWKTDENAPKNAPKITITGKGNLTSSTYTNFTIQPKALEDKDVKAGAVVVVKGSKAEPVLVYNGVKLGKKDYKIAETTADTKGKFTENGTIKLEGQNNFTGNRIINVEVVDSKQNLKKFKVTVNKVDYTYGDGKAHNADVTVTDSNNAPLTPDEDYTIVYSTGNRKNAGTVKFMVVGLNGYTGTVAKSFVVKPRKADLTAELRDKDKEYPFNSAGVTISDDLVVKDTALNAVLKLGKDYKVSYSNNKKVGENAKYTVTFLGNYKGSRAVSGPFTIKAVALSNTGDQQAWTKGLKIELADKIYKKPGQYKSVPYVTLNGVALKKSDYKVEYYLDENRETPMNNTNKVTIAEDARYATVYVKITGKGNYASAGGEYAIASYKVWRVGKSTGGETQLDLSKAKVTFYEKAKYDKDGKETDAKKVTKLPYTGKEVEPGDVVVQIKVGKNLVTVPKSQYKVVYVNNVNKGKATAIITATGDEYVGSKTATFNVVARNLKNDETGLLNNLFKMLGR